MSSKSSPESDDVIIYLRALLWPCYFIILVSLGLYLTHHLTLGININVKMCVAWSNNRNIDPLRFHFGIVNRYIFMRYLLIYFFSATTATPAGATSNTGSPIKAMQELITLPLKATETMLTNMGKIWSKLHYFPENWHEKANDSQDTSSVFEIFYHCTRDP